VLNQVDYDGHQSSVYAQGRALTAEVKATWMSAFSRYAAHRRPLSVLDLGSDTGRFTPAPAETFGGPVYGVEPSSGMRRKAVADAAHPAVRPGRLGGRDPAAGRERGSRAAVPRLAPRAGPGGRRGRDRQSIAIGWRSTVPQHFRRPAARSDLAELLPERGRGGGGDVLDTAADRGRVRGRGAAPGRARRGARRVRRERRGVRAAPADEGDPHVRASARRRDRAGLRTDGRGGRFGNTELPDRRGR